MVANSLGVPKHLILSIRDLAGREQIEGKNGVRKGFFDGAEKKSGQGYGLLNWVKPIN